MNPDHLHNTQQFLKTAIAWLSQRFDVVATWVAQLSWPRFFVYAIIALIVGGILQESVFDSDPVEVVRVPHHKEAKKDRINIHVDAEGVKVKKAESTTPTPSPIPSAPSAPAAPDANLPAPPLPAKPPAAPGLSAPDGSDDPVVMSAIDAAREATEAAREATEALQAAVKQVNDIAEKASKEAEEAANAAAEEKVTYYQKESSSWFRKFIILLILTLLGTKALMGGKKRAEVQASVAREAAEREALNRQVSEAKMQMMQAQVEPHFLFNTLASVEYLIETDPPRAAAMQRSLIKYLRAVLPQMREMTPSTNLGREADMVAAYLDLLKMRMEERLTIELELDDNLRNAAFPPMMLQPLVENAIKHGLECKEQGGTLQVRAEVVGEKLRVAVIDDGVGFGVMPSDGTGLGLHSIRERLNLLFGKQAQLIIEPNEPSGVISIIEVPYKIAK